MDKILTVSIAAYNAQRYLRKCLDSFVTCKCLAKLEIFVVDDGSADDTAAIGLEYQNKYPESIKLISKTNGGHGSTINASIENSTGRYFKVVDSDDWVESDNLDRLVGFLEGSEDDLVLNPFYFVNPDESYHKELSKPCDYCFVGRDIDDVISDLNVVMHSITYRTSVLKQLGSFVTEKCFYVDQEYNLKPLGFVKRVSCLDYPIYDYLFGTLEQSCNQDVMTRRRDQHKKVLIGLLGWYSSLNDISVKLKLYIKSRLEILSYVHYGCYFNLKESIAQEEIREFDSMFYELCPEIYSDILNDLRDIKTIRVIGLLRKVDFLFFNIVKKLRK